MQSRLIEQNLRSLKVPYHVIGGKSFFDRREVKDVLAYASTLLNPADDVSLLRIINTPARGISAATVEKATEWSAQKRCSVFEALRNSEFLDTVATRTRTSIEAFTTFIDAHETAIAQPLADQAALFTKMIEETGYRDDLRRSCKTPEEALGREENLNQLFESLRIAAEKKGDGLRGFLDHMMLRQDREEDDDDAEKAGDAVTLITLHAAKGLEYPRVYLIGLEEGILPHDRSKLEGTVDEERRLLYVGITRARKMLTLTHCKTRVRYGSPEPRNPSSFLKELAPEWLERGTAREIVERPLDENAVQDRFAALRAALAAAGNS
jgi:superfamily I DNA/RNA helicase